MTYYPEVRCEVQEVVPPLGRIAEVRDVDGRLHQINISSSMTQRHGTEDYLPSGSSRWIGESTALLSFPLRPVKARTGFGSDLTS